MFSTSGINISVSLNINTNYVVPMQCNACENTITYSGIAARGKILVLRSILCRHSKFQFRN